MADSDVHTDASIPGLLLVLRRRAKLILACVLIVPGAVLALSLAQQKEYSATASLLFRDPALDQKLFGSTLLQPNRDPAREAQTNVRLVSLKVVAARTARVLPGGLSS